MNKRPLKKIKAIREFPVGFTAEDLGSIPGRGTKIPQGVQWDYIYTYIYIYTHIYIYKSINDKLGERE